MSASEQLKLALHNTDTMERTGRHCSVFFLLELGSSASFERLARWVFSFTVSSLSELEELSPSAYKYKNKTHRQFRQQK
jgi:hypothetical protein